MAAFIRAAASCNASAVAPGGVERAEVFVLVERVELVPQPGDNGPLGKGRPSDARGLGPDLADRFRTQAHGSPLCRMADRIRRRYPHLIEVPYVDGPRLAR